MPLLNEVKQEDVINLFVTNSFPKSKEDAIERGFMSIHGRYKTVWPEYSNLRITKEQNGWSLTNYQTPILYRDDLTEQIYLILKNILQQLLQFKM
jgi:hypothetical protein